jgi:hypothetical protein
MWEIVGIVAARVLPYINPSAAMVEQALRPARSMGDGSSQAVATRVAVAPDGSLLGLETPSQGVEVTRLDGPGPHP